MKFVDPIRDRDTINAAKTWLKARSLRNWALFICGINFALRISDLLRLTVRDVYDGRQIREEFEIRQKKTNGRVRVHIPKNAREALQTYLDEEHPAPNRPEAPLFPADPSALRGDRVGTLKPISRQWANHFLKEAVRQFEPTLQVASHTLRKTWGYQAFKQGVPLELIMHKLGHQSPSATLRYLGIRDDDVRQVTNDLNL